MQNKNMFFLVYPKCRPITRHSSFIFVLQLIFIFIAGHLSIHCEFVMSVSVCPCPFPLTIEGQVATVNNFLEIQHLINTTFYIWMNLLVNNNLLGTNASKIMLSNQKTTIWKCKRVLHSRCSLAFKAPSARSSFARRLDGA